MASGATIRRATWLVAEPNELATTTAYSPESFNRTLGKVSVALVIPAATSATLTLLNCVFAGIVQSHVGQGQCGAGRCGNVRTVEFPLVGQRRMSGHVNAESRTIISD